MTAQLLLLAPSDPPRRPARQVTPVQATQLAGHALRVLRRLEPSPRTRDTVLSWANALMAEGRLRPCPHPLQRFSRDGAEDRQLELDLWSDDALLTLHEVLLDHSLHTLGDGRASPSSVADVWAWLEAVPTVPPRLFSFHLCCRLAGLDPDTLHEHLTDLARRGRIRSAAAAISGTCC
ncbi:MAG: hypothetical protein U1F76_20970 [Candidatus Competibacteraceae bacterium]